MKTTLKEALLDNLESKCSNIGQCIVALNSQGYLVNANKWFKLRIDIILKEQIKYINSFSENVENRIINLFNSIS